MNFMKSKAGFTLVELIVVIAILAILAGIAVPVYSGYISKAESAADMQALSTISTAAQGLVAAEGETTTSITVAKDNAGAWTVAVEPASAAVTSAEVLELTGTLSFTDDFAGATWSSADGGKWTLS